MRDWHAYAEKKLGRKVERTQCGKGLMLTEDEIDFLTRPSLWWYALCFCGPFVLATVLSVLLG